MADLKEIFEQAENGTLTYEQFLEAAKAQNAKFKDVSTGEYVSKQKYTDDLTAKTKEIETLNGTISTRDTDLADLQQKLAAAGTDAEKLQTLNNDLTALQTKYDKDVQKYQEQLKAQAYEFAVKSYAAEQDFSSAAARRDFVHEMLGAKLTMDGDKIIGAADFKESYAANNADAFKVAAPLVPEPTPEPPKPSFAGPTPGNGSGEVTMTLTELMKAKNDNPDLSIRFED